MIVVNMDGIIKDGILSLDGVDNLWFTSADSGEKDLFDSLVPVTLVGHQVVLHAWGNIPPEKVNLLKTRDEHVSCPRLEIKKKN